MYFPSLILTHVRFCFEQDNYGYIIAGATGDFAGVSGSVTPFVPEEQDATDFVVLVTKLVIYYE